VRRGENVDQITLPNPNPSFFASLGRYEQEYVRQNGKWLFKRVTIAEMSKATVAPAVKAAAPTPQEQANMKLVADFHEAIEQDYQHGSKGVRAIAERFLAPDYIQHMEAAGAFGPGREGYIRMFEQTPAPPPAPVGGGAPPPMTVLSLMADGDLVTRINSRPGATPDQPPIYIFNLYRVKDGRLAEHWDGYSRPQGGPGTGNASGSGK
jgi:predicted SnoaL-like aldol condensation-catalyzing enzyme